MTFLYRTQQIGEKTYITGWKFVDPKRSPKEPYEVTRTIRRPLMDENRRFQWTIRENPDYSPETDHIDDRYLIEYDPILPTAEEIEAEHQRKIERQLQAELPKLILANKNNPAALVQVLCDRAKQIEVGTKR